MLAAALEGQELGKLTHNPHQRTRSLPHGSHSDNVMCDLEFNYEVTKKLDVSPHRYGAFQPTSLAEATAIDSLDRSNPVTLLSRELAISENLQNEYLNGKRTGDNGQ